MIGQILFKVGSVTFYTHGIFLVLAIIASGAIIYLLAKKRNLDYTIILDLIIYTMLAGLIGARVAYYILYHDQFYSFWQIFRIWEGGLVSWGGFILGTLVFIAILRIYKQDILDWLDLLGISSLLGVSIGRMGSFLSGEYAGVDYRGFLSVAGVHPITLYESFWCITAFIILITLYLKFKDYFSPGIYALESLLLYTIGRFAIDFFRAEKDLVWKLSLGQVVSLLFFVASVILFITIIGRGRKSVNDIS